MSRPQFLPRCPPAKPEEIKALRLAAGLSMAHLAKLLQVSIASLENWEQGRYPLPAPIFKLLRIICAPRIRKRQFVPVVDAPEQARILTE
jgi:DNA-binding transcriptional regulator YiaG